jgi:hypothetical protein
MAIEENFDQISVVCCKILFPCMYQSFKYRAIENSGNFFSGAMQL